jgi:hypothetical protein
MTVHATVLPDAAKEKSSKYSAVLSRDDAWGGETVFVSVSTFRYQHLSRHGAHRQSDGTVNNLSNPLTESRTREDRIFDTRRPTEAGTMHAFCT